MLEVEAAATAEEPGEVLEVVVVLEVESAATAEEPGEVLEVVALEVEAEGQRHVERQVATRAARRSLHEGVVGHMFPQVKSRQASPEKQKRCDRYMKPVWTGQHRCTSQCTSQCTSTIACFCTQPVSTTCLHKSEAVKASPQKQKAAIGT